MMENDAEGEIADMLSMCNKYPNFEDDDFERYVITNSHDVVTVFDGSPAVIVLDKLVKSDASKYLPFKMQKSYEKVDEIAAKMASEEIHFTIHLSSHSQKNVLQIFQSAYSDGYTEEDKDGKIPEGGRVKCAETETGARSNVKCEEVVKEVNERMDSEKEKFGDLKVESLGKAERNLDGYTYFSFMKQKPRRNLFIRVPPLEGACTKEVVHEAIKLILFYSYC